MLPWVPHNRQEGGDAPEILARFRAELELVEIVARQVSRRIGPAVTLDDLRSFGREGLLQAARTFDPDRGVPFRRWANLRVKGAVFDGIRRWGGLPRRVYRELRALEAADLVQANHDEEHCVDPTASPEAADARLATYLAGMATAMVIGAVAIRKGDPDETASSAASPEDMFGKAELLARIKTVVARLPEKERTLLERHYFAGETLEDAAASLGLSKSWGSRLHARAIEALTEELRRTGDV
jgi:RNA polymerase sigma factor for flagellar operon FliA